MKKEKKISYYSLEDIEKIGAINNVDCSAKSAMNVLALSMPFFLLLAGFQTFVEILETGFWEMLILFGIYILLLVDMFAYLFRVKPYSRFINFHLSIQDKEIVYKNESGQVFYYRIEDLVSAKERDLWVSRKFHRRQRIHLIELTMRDQQIIRVKAFDRHFYQLMMYLEQEELF